MHLARQAGNGQSLIPKRDTGNIEGNGRVRHRHNYPNKRRTGAGSPCFEIFFGYSLKIGIRNSICGLLRGGIGTKPKQSIMMVLRMLRVGLFAVIAIL